MQVRSTVAALALAATAVSGCGASETAPTTTSPPSPRATTTTTTTEPLPTTLVESVCLSGDTPFVDDGVVARLGDGAGDAEQLASVRWAAHAGCERVVVDLLAAGAAPASSVGEATVTILEGTGVIRISLPDAVRRTGIADSLLEGDLAQRAFVVRMEDGTLAVDIHTATSVPIRTRAFTVDAPARIVVDLAPAAEGGATVATPPLVGPNVVVLSPRGGEVAYPVRVIGYARTFEATVIARMLVDGDIATEVFTTAADWLDAWGAFSLELPSGPAGPVQLFVGEDDAGDGSARGISVDVMVP
jgi:hypothetical protein